MNPYPQRHIVASEFAPSHLRVRQEPPGWPRYLLQSLLVTGALSVAAIALPTAFIGLILIGDAGGSMCCLTGDWRPLGFAAAVIGVLALRGGYLAAFWKKPWFVRRLSGDKVEQEAGFDYLARGGGR